jgi:hypothetical protein
MTERKAKFKQTKSSFDFFDLMTKRISKIKALVVVIGALVVAILMDAKQIIGVLSELKLYTPSPCVEVEDLKLPKKIKYSEWENMKITLKGRNNCSTPLGLYVMFLPHATSERRIVLRGPHENYTECRCLATSQDPKCWDPKKPIKRGKGNWEWNVPPPHLEKLSDTRPIEKISINWYVYDYDAPNKPAILTGTDTIEVHDDSANTP